MLLVQNEQKKESEIEKVMSDIEEEVSAVNFVDEAREPEHTEDDFNEDNEDLVFRHAPIPGKGSGKQQQQQDFGMSFVSPSGKRWIETVPAHSERRHSANILRQKGELQPMPRRKFTT